MTRRKQVKIKIIGLKKQINIHEEKIRDELNKSHPNLDRINHWATEIIIFQDQIDTYKKMLDKNKKGMNEDD
jgi:hypothetical protein